MALGDLMASRLSGSSPFVSNHLDELSGREDRDGREAEAAVPVSRNSQMMAYAGVTSLAYLSQTVVLSDFRHEGFEDFAEVGPSDNGLVSKWRPKDRIEMAPHGKSVDEELNEAAKEVMDKLKS